MNCPKRKGQGWGWVGGHWTGGGQFLHISLFDQRQLKHQVCQTKCETIPANHQEWGDLIKFQVSQSEQV